MRVTLTIPSLQESEDDGDVVGHSVQIKIQIQYNGGGYNDVINDTISGKSSNRYQRDYLIDFTGSHPVDVRMVRVSADETSQKRASTTIFQSFTEIIDDKFRYPNSALVALRFDSRQFNSIPVSQISDSWNQGQDSKQRDGRYHNASGADHVFRHLGRNVPSCYLD